MPETAPTVFSGESGAISVAGSVWNAIRNWKVSKKSDNQAVVDSATSGGTTRLGGNADWSGSFMGDGYPAAYPGDAAFIGSIDGVTGVTGSITIESVRVNYDISTGAPVTHEVAFSGNGTLTEGAAVAVDVSVADPVPSIGVVVSLAPASADQSEAYVVLAQVQTITLEFKRPAQSYADSSSAGYTKRKRGPLDWTLSMKVSPDATTGNAAYGLAGLPQPKDVKGIKIEDADGLTYLLDWGMFEELGDVEANRETQAIVSCTLNASMCGTTRIATVATLGSITDPNEVAVWPEAA